MASEVKTNKISPSTSTTVTLGDASDVFQLPASAEIDIASGATLDVNGTIDLTGATTTGFPAGGLTDAPIWRQNTTTSASTTDTFFTAGWEIPDNTDTGYGTLGTAVGETSGVFDFPSTGYWLVIFNIMITASGGEREGIGRIHATEDDGTYVECSKATCSSGNTLNDTATMFHLMKVEDIADYKIKFSHAMAGLAGTVQGSTTVNQTYAVFVKLAGI